MKNHGDHGQGIGDPEIESQNHGSVGRDHGIEDRNLGTNLGRRDRERRRNAKKSPKSKESRVISKWDDYNEASEGSKSPQIIEKDDEVLIGTETVKGRVYIYGDFSFRQFFSAMDRDI